jgi:hypothetical protein
MSRWSSLSDSQRRTALTKGAAIASDSVGQAVQVMRARVLTARGSALVASSVTSLRVAVWLAGVMLLCLVYFFPHNDADQNAHTDLAVALVEHGTVSVDPYAANTIDSSYYHHHYYVLKAPGLSLLDVPVYLLYKASLSTRSGLPANPANDPQLWYLESIGVVALPTVLFLLFFFWFLGYFSSSLIHRALLTLALGLGTDFFPYGQNLYSHVPVAIMLFVAFALVYIMTNEGTVRGPWTQRLVDRPNVGALLVGVALGGVVLTEFDAALLACVVGLYALLRLPRRVIPYVLLGGVPPLLILMAFNYAAYGNPVKVSYTSGTSQWNAVFAQGLDGFVWPPTRDALWSLSFGSFRGLFFLSPFLLLAIPGFLLWRRRGGREWLVCLVGPVLYFLVISMYVVWDGGWAVGPRLLIPTLPLLTLPIIFTLEAIESWRVSRQAVGLIYGLVYLLVFYSMVAIWAEAIAGNTPLWPDEGNHNVLFSANLPALLQGSVMPNLATAHLGANGGDSVILLLELLVIWSFAAYLPPVVGWVQSTYGWPSARVPLRSVAWRRSSPAVPAVPSRPERPGRVSWRDLPRPVWWQDQPGRVQLWLRSVSAGPVPAPQLAAAERGLAFRPEYLVLRQTDTGVRLALWLTLGLRVGLGLVGAWAAIAHPAVPVGHWTSLIIQDGKSWSDVLSSWQRWDGLWFQQIAQNGYHAGDGTYRFGPLYPLLVHVFSPVLGGAPVAAELLVSSLAFLAASFLLYCLARELVGPVSAALAVALLAFFPTGFLLLAPYSQGLLLALTLLAFLLARNGRPWLAGIAGFAAALTHPIGMLLFLPLAIEYVQRRRREEQPIDLRFLSAGLPLLAALLFNVYLHTAVGATHWFLPWTGFAKVPSTPVIPRGDPIEVINVVCLVGCLALVLAATQWLPASLVAYSGVLFGLLAGSEIQAPLTGMAQTALLLFPCYLVLALWLVRRPSLAAAWLVMSTLLQALLLMMWVRFVFLG